MNYYKKQGITQSFLPKVSFNRITVDLTDHGKPNANVTIDPYIKEKSGTGHGEIGFGGKAAKVLGGNVANTALKVESSIIFNVPNAAEFKKILMDDDFGNSVKIYAAALYSTSYSNWDIFEKNDVDVLNNYFPIKDAAKADPNFLNTISTNTSNWNKAEATLSDILYGNWWFDDDNNKHTPAIQVGGLANIDRSTPAEIFEKYQKQLPDGQICYQIPYTLDFTLLGAHPQNLYLCAFATVEDFDLDISFNFGDFDINDSDITMNAFDAFADSSDFSPDPSGNAAAGTTATGPLTTKTIIEFGNVPSTDVAYTISSNQSGPGLSTAGYNETQADLLREERSNDIKGMPWYGPVHIEPTTGRYMAGGAHDPEELHPFLDVNSVPNNKIVDLRVLEKIKTASVTVSDAGLVTNFMGTVDYFANKPKGRNAIMDKVNVISEPLLSTDPEGDVSGFFGIDYTKFLKKHGIANIWSFDVFNSFSGGVPLLKSLLKKELEDNLNIKIVRIGPDGQKTIFESNGVNDIGLYVQYTKNKNTDVNPDPPFTTNNLGYLTPIKLTAPGGLGANIGSNYNNAIDGPNLGNFVEFYSFTDMDKKKLKDVKYHYKVEATFSDPTYSFLSDGLAALDRTMEGKGKQLGLNQLLKMIETIKGINTSMKSSATLNISPYIAATPYSEFFSGGKLQVAWGDYLAHWTQLESRKAYGGTAFDSFKNPSLLNLIKEYDGNNGVSSLDSNGRPQVLNDLLSSKIVLILVNLYFATQLGSPVNFMGDMKDKDLTQMFDSIFKLEDVDSLSTGLINRFISDMNTLRATLKNVLDGLSNVNFTKATSITNSALGSSKFPGSGNAQQRRITAEKTSTEHIKILDHGLDYTEILSKNYHQIGPADTTPKGYWGKSRVGLKQIPYKGVHGYENNVKNWILPRYLSKAVIDKALSGELNVEYEFEKSGTKTIIKKITTKITYGDPSTKPGPDGKLGTDDDTVGETYTVDKEETIVETVEGPIGTAEEQAINVIRKNGLSVLPLPTAPLPALTPELHKTIQLPERLVSDLDLMKSASTPGINKADILPNLLNMLLLYGRGQLSKIDNSTIFGFNQIKKSTSKYDYAINAEIETEVDQIKDLGKLRSVERNQTLMTEKGLNVQDKTTSDHEELLVVVADDQTGETKTVMGEQTGFRTDPMVSYFLSFINNLTSNLAKGDTPWADTKPEYLYKDADVLTVQLLALALYGQNNKSALLGNPSGKNTEDFDDYYKKTMKAWRHADNPDPGQNQLVYSNYATYFFDFINTVKVEYLKGFGKYDTTALLAEGQSKPIAMDINISQYVWEKFHPKIIGEMGEKEVLLCKLSNYAAPPFTMNRTRKALQHYPLFYKYFLIVNSSSEDLEIKPLGSML